MAERPNSLKRNSYVGDLPLLCSLQLREWIPDLYMALLLHPVDAMSSMTGKRRKLEKETCSRRSPESYQRVKVWFSIYTRPKI